MFCGGGSLSRVDEDVEPSAAPTIVPKSSSSSSSKKSSKQINPYSSRGLEKFSTVLTELERKREKIMAKMIGGSEGAGMVRFMYNSSKDWIPIVIRRPKPPAPPTKPIDIETTKKEMETAVTESSSKKVIHVGENKPQRRWKPSLYWPLVVVVVLILLSLIMFGRAFAICCTSLCWYLLPTVKKNWGGGDGENKLPLKKKKENGRTNWRLTTKFGKTG